MNFWLPQTLAFAFLAMALASIALGSSDEMFYGNLACSSAYGAAAWIIRSAER